jgi:membrane protein DedA with SNARE-associated domain
MLASLLSQYQDISYIIFFFGIIAEGEFIVLTAGFLASLGVLFLPLVYIMTILGVIAGDIVWYGAGYRFGDSVIRKIGLGRWRLINEERMKYIESHFNDSTAGRTLFVAKFLYGLSHITYLLSGAAKLPFKKFIKPAATSSILWSMIFVTLGFFFGHSFNLLHRYTKDFGISLTIVVILILLIEYIWKKETKGKI